MTIQKKTLKAHLIRYREPTLEDYIWFWINPNTGHKISGDFLTQEDAETWFHDMVRIYDESTLLLKRTSKGNFFVLQGLLENQNIPINDNCPFQHSITVTEAGENILIARVLGMDEYDAKHRIQQFYDIKEWIESNE